ncbi:MAG: hypothetical protein HC854_16640 [Flavobacterium sp.]|nr:hypothetical protein [Flavobacterium sp.]
MGKIYTRIVAVLLMLNSNIFTAQTINIPDENFKKALLEKHWYNPILDKNNDGEIQLSEASTYTGEISVSYKGIKSLEGIENFVSIKELNCSGNNLTKLDVSKNILLEKIVANNCNLNEIDLTKNLVLEKLSIENNNLLNLNLSSNKSIIR